MRAVNDIGDTGEREIGQARAKIKSKIIMKEGATL